MTIGNYVRMPVRGGSMRVQIIVPKNFLSTDRLVKNKRRAMNEIKNDAYDFWVTQAGQKLNKTRDTYVNNLFVTLTPDNNIVFELKNPAMAIERGYKSFDMKPGFAASPKLEKKKLKIPKDKRSELMGKGPSLGVLIIPIDPQRGIFRTFSLRQMNTGLWVHPGYAGVHIVPELKKQLKENIIKKRFGRFLRDSFAK